MMYELYLITNKINGKKYVGQTRSDIGYLARFNQHISESFYNTKHVSVLHKAIRKYGRDNFEVKRLMHGITEDKIDEIERIWIRRLNTFYLNGDGYNMTIGGQGVHGYHHSEETKQKISKSIPKTIYTKERSEKMKKTKQLRGTQVNRNNSEWLKNIQLAAKKRYETSPGTFTGKHHSEATKKKLSSMKGNPIVAYYTDTKKLFKVFPSAKAACDYLIEVGITSNKCALVRIIYICNGNGRSAYGYIWRFLKDVTTIPKGSREEDELPLEAHVLEEIV